MARKPAGTPENQTEAKTTENTITEEKENAQTTPTRAKRQRMDETELVPVQSRVHGILVYDARSGETFTFEKFEDEEMMEIREIRTMMNKGFFKKGWAKILDEEVAEYLNVEKYSNLSMSVEDIEDLLNQTPEVVEEVLKTVSNNAKRSILKVARDQYHNRKLTNVYVKDVIEKVLKEPVDANLITSDED